MTAKSFSAILSALFLMAALTCAQNAKAAVLVPKIEGPWWQVAGSPDLGKFCCPA